MLGHKKKELNPEELKQLQEKEIAQLPYVLKLEVKESARILSWDVNLQTYESNCKTKYSVTCHAGEDPWKYNTAVIKDGSGRKIASVKCKREKGAMHDDYKVHYSSTGDDLKITRRYPWERSKQIKITDDSWIVKPHGWFLVSKMREALDALKARKYKVKLETPWRLYIDDSVQIRMTRKVGENGYRVITIRSRKENHIPLGIILSLVSYGIIEHTSTYE